MKSLYEHYQTLRESYYQIPIDAESLFNGLSGKQNCYAFINDHFIKGNKKSVFTIPETYKQSYQIYGKHQHTVSLYLLGLLCKRLVSTRLKNRMQELFDISNWYHYEYTWYLTCLYHDITSVMEKDQTFAFRADLVAESKLFDQTSKLLRFPKDVYINYILYRQSNGSAEHGIIAGTELFDRLYESFTKKTTGHDWETSPVCRKGNLEWRREHPPHFAYIADAVCCHNIWLTPKDNVKLCDTYEQASLDTLIVKEDSDKLSFTQHPLQFMLCLLDTIEPIKRFENIPADVVLKNIYLDLRENGITLGWTHTIKEHPKFLDWLKSVSTIGEWMQVGTTPCFHKDDRCFITIFWKKEDTPGAL